MTGSITRPRRGLRPPTAPRISVARPLPRVLIPFELEREMQLHLATHPDLWESVGWPELTLRAAEFRLEGRRRADLLYEQFDRPRRRAVVVEMKRGTVDDAAVTQVLRYRGWIDAGAAGRFAGRSEAILVGEALDVEAARRVSAAARLTFVSLAALGIASTSRFRSDEPPAW